MTKSSTVDFRKALRIITEVVEGQLSKLPSKVADKKRERIHQIASKAGLRSRGIILQS